MNSTIHRWLAVCAATLSLMLAATSAGAAGYPAPLQGTWTARDFRFHTGEVLPEVKLAYTTIGAPTGLPVLVLHGRQRHALPHAGLCR